MLNAETKRRIDNARDILVGKVPDPKTQVEQITFAMIYKFMDDMDQISVKLGGKPSFFNNGYEGFAWSKLMDKKLSGIQRLDLYVRALEGMSNNPFIPQLFRDVFKGAFLPYRDSETLNLFLKEMNGFTYDHSEDLGDAYEYLLSIFATQGKAGQFRTPRHIIDFIVDCVNPGLHDSVLDPACGTAGFLISAYKHITEKHRDNPLTPDQKQRLTENFVGYDISPDMVRLSRVNMYLHQFPNPTIHEYDTLTTEDRWDETFDVILANPPFMTPKGGIRPHKRFAVRANRSEVLFVDYIAEHLNVGGRAGVIVPEGIIFQTQKAYIQLRKMLVENFLTAVISLPQGVFNPYSGVKTSILLMDKTRAVLSDYILFAKVLDDGYDLGSTRRKIGDGDLPEILETIRRFYVGIVSNINFSDFEYDDDKFLLVSKEKIKESGEWRLSAEQFRPQKISRNSQYSFVKLSEILIGLVNDKVNNEQSIPILSMTMESGLIDQSEKFSKRIASKNISNYKKVTKDQLVEGFPIDEGVLAIQNKYPYAAVSPAYRVWVVNKNIVNLSYLELILRSDHARTIYKRLMHGTAGRRRTINKDIFLGIRVPLPPLEVQQEIVDEIEGYQKVIDGARQVVENYKPVIPIDPNWPLVKLGEVITLEYGKPLKKDVRVPGDYPVFGSNGIVGYHNEFLVEGPLIIVGRKGSAGAVTYSKKNGFPIDTTFFVNIIDRSKLDLKFLYYQLLHLELDKVNVQSGVPGLNRNDAYQVKIYLPSLNIQEKIIADIEKEEMMVNVNKNLLERFEAKIAARIQSVWGAGC